MFLSIGLRIEMADNNFYWNLLLRAGIKKSQKMIIYGRYQKHCEHQWTINMISQFLGVTGCIR